LLRTIQQVDERSDVQAIGGVIANYVGIHRATVGMVDGEGGVEQVLYESVEVEDADDGAAIRVAGDRLE
jgi:hypothetical protein